MDQSRNRKLATTLTLALALTACGPQYTRIAADGAQVDIGGGYKATLPVGWVKFTDPATPDLIAWTKDGFAVQRMSAACLTHADAFKNLAKPSTETLTPNELSELYAADLRASPSAPQFAVISTVPTTIAGKRGFSSVHQRKTSRGLEMRSEAVGFSNATHFCALTYSAPTLHYFDRDIEAFRVVLNSVSTK